MTTFVGVERLAALGLDAAAAHQQALRDLVGTESSWRWVESAIPGGAWLELFVVEGPMAAERILDHEAMLHAQDLVAGGKLLAVGIPHRGLLLTASPHAAASGAFAALVRSLHDDPSSQGAVRLCPLVFLVDRGRVVGHAG